MRKRSKRYRAALALVGERRDLPVVDAVALLQKLPGTKFDETVNFAAKLGIDPKQSNQIVRGSVTLPHGLGKTRKVIVFAEGEKAEEARAAGAEEVGSTELAKKIQDGWLDFDVAIAAPDMMRHVGKLGKVLGPQGKMPSPKAGTVTPDVATAVREFRAGKIEFRNDKEANVHAPVGRKSFPAEKLCENITAFLDHLRSLRPPAAKGNYIERVTISTTMGPGIRLSLN